LTPPSSQEKRKIFLSAGPFNAKAGADPRPAPALLLLHGVRFRIQSPEFMSLA